MYYCNTTFDIAIADAYRASALPFERGIIRHTGNAGIDYFTNLKTLAYFYKLNDFGGKNYNKDWGWVWVGDAWIQRYKEVIIEGYFDAYGETPMFPLECIAMLCDLPTTAETIIRWQGGLERYAHNAAEERALMAERNQL